MKRFLSMLLASLMILSLAVVMVVPTSAAVVEGDWVTSRSGNDYEDETTYCPAPGYHYDAELGFVMDPPEYAKETTPFVQAHTKQPVNLKGDNDGKGNSVALEVTVLEYAYDGEEGGKDQWICFTLNSQPISCPGNVNYGEGLCILIRGAGDGRAQVQPFYVDKTGGKNFSQLPVAFPSVEVPFNEDDQEVYTFRVKYDDTGYTFAVNDHWFAADAYLNSKLDEVCPDGAYVGLVCQTGEADTKISLAITEWQGDLPVGDDSLQAEEDLREKAPIADPTTVPENQPAVLWDSTLRDFRKIDPAGATYTINEDGTVHLVAQTQSPYISFGIKSEVSHEASAFPYIAVLTKDCWANSGNVFYCAGPNLSASNDYSENWDLEDTAYADGWSLGIMDFSDYNEDGWYGRINSIRVGFDFSADDIIDDELNNFDIAFIGAFRSPEEAYAYTEAYLTALGVDTTVTTEEPTTEAPTTEAPTTEAPTTEAPTTEAPVAGTEETTTEAEKTSGCGAVIAAPVVALIALMGVAFVAKKKD